MLAGRRLQAGSEGGLALARTATLLLFLGLVIAISWHLLDRYRTWHLWEGFKHGYIAADGRVIDHLQDGRSTSEGQAYAMFFALAANDRASFDKILRWTERHLAQGDVSRHLPAWHWGQGTHGKWQILDHNSATDADLWLAYNLIEAARVWDVPSYRLKGNLLAKKILAENLVELEGKGPMLLPAPHGFKVRAGVWRLNSSYLPPFLLSRLAEEQPYQPWNAIARTSATLIQESAQSGLVPDWHFCCENGELVANNVTPQQSGYEAIRVYLWLALSAQSNPQHGATFGKIQGMSKIIENHDAVPERIHIGSGEINGWAPVGFTAAMLPYLHISGKDMLLSRLEKRVTASWRSHTVGERAHYYDAALGLFALGWLHGQYSFDPKGRLLTRWSGYGV